MKRFLTASPKLLKSFYPTLQRQQKEDVFYPMKTR